MIENVTHSISGMSLYGVISICLFVAVFVGVLVWTIRLKKSYVNSMRELPLEDEPAADIQPIEPPPNPQVHHD
jgi:cytochrome c oxidase cbb3-type subunit 4